MSEYVIEKPTEFITVNEAQRIYTYKDKTISFKDIESICVRSSGSHRLNLKNGDRVVVQPGWLTLRIKGLPEWIF